VLDEEALCSALSCAGHICIDLADALANAARSMSVDELRNAFGSGRVNSVQAWW